MNEPAKNVRGRDYRFLTFGLITVYILVLLMGEFWLGSYARIGRYFALHPFPYFVDLRILLCGTDAVRVHGDPYATPCVHGIPYFNYPLIWGFLAFVPGFTASHLIALGWLLTGASLLAIYWFLGRLDLRRALIYAVFLLSSAVMLGLERGNCDLIILLVLILALMLSRSQSALALAILVTSLLKLFPIAALMALWRRGSSRLGRTLLWAVGVVIAFLVYFWMARDNIRIAVQKTPSPFSSMSYGLGCIPSTLANQMPHFATQIVAGYLAAIVAGWFLFCRYSRSSIADLKIGFGRDGVAFLAGSGIFIATCLMGYNWEYRLIFLILTLPQILIWVDEGRTVGWLMLALTLTIPWQSFYALALAQIGIRLDLTHLFSQSLVVVLFYSHLRVILNLARQELWPAFRQMASSSSKQA